MLNRRSFLGAATGLAVAGSVLEAVASEPPAPSTAFVLTSHTIDSDGNETLEWKAIENPNHPKMLMHYREDFARFEHVAIQRIKSDRMANLSSIRVVAVIDDFGVRHDL